MDSAANGHHNHHHHHLDQDYSHQEQQLQAIPIGSSSSPSSQSSSYGGGSSSNHANSWRPASSQQYYINSMDHHHAVVGSSGQGKCMVRGSRCSRDDDDDDDDEMSDVSEKLLLKTISSGFPMFPTTVTGAGSQYRRASLQIYPSVNVSTTTSTKYPSSSNLQPLDLFRSFDLHQLRLRSTQFNPSNLHIWDSSSSTSLITRSNERDEDDDDNEMGEVATKKPRLDHSRSSCPPFKARKEKLGDRIAALQQLVAPFGKTDTASVLMEAIGYIKFLENQVETLSVPYMKLPSRNYKHNLRSNNYGDVKLGEESNQGNINRDLRSRGLCLVPMSCLSFVTSDGGAGFSPPPSYGGGSQRC